MAKPETTILGGVARPGSPRYVLPGQAEVRRAQLLGFPAHCLIQEGHPIASLGRYSFLSIYFGRGQRIELPDGRRWRLWAMGSGGSISPVVTNSEGLRVSQAGLRHRHYGINGRDYAYELIPGEAVRIGRSGLWTLTRHEDYIAHFTRRPRRVTVLEPVPLPAVLLSFVLMDFGIPGEHAPRIPKFTWA